MPNTKRLIGFLSLVICLFFCSQVSAGAQNNPSTVPAANLLSADLSSYRINAGDILSINVWNEESVSLKEVLVRPDGRISLPIVGEIQIGGKTIQEAQTQIASGLSKLLVDKPVVSIAVLQLAGNTVFVLGKVARPGQFIISGRLDVAQALALAGGTTTFARENDIKILRRLADGTQKAIDFNYSKITDGKKLETNILLQSGDLVLVP